MANYVCMYVEKLPSFLMSKIHRFFFEFLGEIRLLFRRVINGIKKKKQYFVNNICSNTA